MSHDEGERLLTDAEFREMLTGVSRSTVWRWRRTRAGFPRARQLGPGHGKGGRIGYVRSEVRAWLEGLRVAEVGMEGRPVEVRLPWWQVAEIEDRLATAARLLGRAGRRLARLDMEQTLGDLRRAVPSLKRD